MLLFLVLFLVLCTKLWVENILEGRKEVDRVIFRDEDEISGFVIFIIFIIIIIIIILFF